MVSMRQLRYFVEIVEAGSYSLAAERLFVAQSALSRQVKELEASAQVQLLTRGARRFELTQAGKTFYDGAKRLLFNL
ncbi:UNVERIFIED_ORG: DNA-binding transcriptional LysR family regulator, partial [Burkholderia sp. 1595]